jgi:hypothetical protein
MIGRAIPSLWVMGVLAGRALSFWRYMKNVIEMLKLRIQYYKSGIELFRGQVQDYMPGEKRYHALQGELENCHKCINDIERAIEILEHYIK